MKPVLVKIGGSLITDKKKKETPNTKTLSLIAREIRKASEKNTLIVGHGGGSFPHYPAKKYAVTQGITNKNSIKGYCLTNDAAARLNRIVVKSFLNAGINTATVQPSACFTCKNGEIFSSYTKPIQEMLIHNIVPVPYGDAVMDLKKGITILSTEQILAELAVKLNAKRIAVAGLSEGVFTGDPFKDKNAELIPKISDNNFKEIRKMLSGSHGVDVTGGMLSKVEFLLALARKGIKSQIIGGKKPGSLEKAIKGKRIGTIIE